MTLKKKFREFFTLTRKAEGFTLVELIVVIAIMAILAGVAVPAYTGYIAKAETAADEQLLADVNTAFAAACMVNGVDNFGRTDVSIELGDSEDGMAVTALTVGAVDDFYDTFEGFYEGGVFKKTVALEYKPAEGRFVDPATAETVTVMIGGYRIEVSKELADTLKAEHTFREIGADVLLGKVDTVSDIAALLVGLKDEETGELKMDSTFNQIVFDEEGVYLANLQKTLGLEGKDAEFYQFVMNEDGSWKTDVLANSLVLSAAQKTQGMDTSFLGTKGSAATLRSELDNPETATDAMAKLALTYGMYTSYVKSTPGMEDKSATILANKTFTGMTSVLSEIESEDFQTYLESDKGQADLNAYMASMQIVNNSTTQSTDCTKDILTGGFTDPELVDALGKLMGE